jgi:hypothetical protein
MSYIEKVMGDKEQILYRTHQHAIVLFQRLLSSFFAFVVFLAIGLVVLIPKADEAGNQIRFIVGLIALGSLVMPIYLIASAWLRGLRGSDFTKRIWRAALAGILILVVSLIMILSPEFKLTGWIALVIAAVPGFELIRIILDWLNERYIITNRRVMEVKGIVNKHIRDSALEKVNDVELDQSVVGRLLGYGTVQIITGSDIGVNMFRRISNPVRFKREMLNAKEELGGEDQLVKRDQALSSTAPEVLGATTGTDPDSAASIPDLIAELDELRQKGIISDEEFQAKKKELLERL